jgi:protein involved in polysaccharide export with SLBB domain
VVSVKSKEGDRTPQKVLWIAMTAMTLLMGSLAARAQTQERNRPQTQSQNQGQRGSESQNPPLSVPPDIAAGNLSYVAAPAARIEAILREDLGLMVELKRWVASDAAGDGQILSESDLADQAIFDRLELDVKFRSVATRLLQRYGYLLPVVNPNSELGKERELLLKERTKWMAQNEEMARQKAIDAGEREKTCDPQSDRGCASAQGRVSTSEMGRSAPPAGSLEQNPSSQPLQPRAPGGNWEQPETLPPQLVQTGGETQTLNRPAPSPLPGGRLSSPYDANGGNPAAAGIEGNRDQSFASPANPTERNEWGTPSGAGNLANGEMSSQPGYGAENYRRPGLSGSPLTGKTNYPQPAIVSKPDPYAGIPSLFDMYKQVASKQEPARRFGLDIFQAENRNPALIPMDLPVGPDYVVGPGDGLAIDLWGGVSQRVFRTVDREGRVSLPEVGPILVSGKTLGEVQQNLQKILRTQFRDVSADVSLARLRTVRIYVVGDVEHPGAYDVSSLSTPLNALFAAGGPASQGSLRVLEHYRGKQLTQTVDVYELLLHGVRSGIERLENGDTVLVPPLGPEVTVQGMVRRPAVYEMHGEKSLADVLNLAGGVLPTAALGHIEVQRLEAHEKRTMLSLNIPQAKDSTAVTEQLTAFSIHDGDIVNIFPIAPYNQDAVYLEGHVLLPGRYAYHKGMKLTDVISSYSDLLPEPAGQYAEIIRLNPPDYSPSVVSFDLARALADPAAAPALEPLDTVRIFGRYDFQNSPTVTIGGAVRRPGTYITSGQVHLRDAIELAGGLTPDAQTQGAQVFHYLPDSRLKVTSVNLSDALAGNPLDNILLEPRDHILVHMNIAKMDPPAVLIKGDVARPGRYPLTAGMRVADLIRLGGGLKRSADPELADLTRTLSTDSAQPSSEHEQIHVARALAGDATDNPELREGDVLSVPQIAGWQDLGAAIAVRGAVRRPGTYGIRPGARLSTILKMAGGFQADSYPYGAVLQRSSIREIEERSRAELVDRVRRAQVGLKVNDETDPDKKLNKEAAYQQWESTVQSLEHNPPVGRLAIRISSDIHHWENTPADIEVRAGDVLTIPKKLNYVMVTGQVYNATAISYRPGKSANWYLEQAGGPTQLANKKAIFVIRADGSVIGGTSGFGLWGGSSLSSVLQPGDTIVAPERALGGSKNWAIILQAAGLAASVASTAIFASRL